MTASQRGGGTGGQLGRAEERRHACRQRREQADMETHTEEGKQADHAVNPFTGPLVPGAGTEKQLPSSSEEERTRLERPACKGQVWSSERWLQVTVSLSEEGEAAPSLTYGFTGQMTAQSDRWGGGGAQGMKRVPDGPHFSQVDQSDKQQHGNSCTPSRVWWGLFLGLSPAAGPGPPGPPAGLSLQASLGSLVLPRQYLNDSLSLVWMFMRPNLEDFA